MSDLCVQNGIKKLLDAYQEGLLQIEELRERVPELRKREEALLSELRSMEAATADQQMFIRLVHNIEDSLSHIHTAADTLNITDRQNILRLVVKKILVGRSTLMIKYTIPVPDSNTPKGPSKRSEMPGCLLRSGSR